MTCSSSRPDLLSAPAPRVTADHSARTWKPSQLIEDISRAVVVCQVRYFPRKAMLEVVRP